MKLVSQIRFTKYSIESFLLPTIPYQTKYLSSKPEMNYIPYRFCWQCEQASSGVACTSFATCGISTDQPRFFISSDQECKCLLCSGKKMFGHYNRDFPLWQTCSTFLRRVALLITSAKALCSKIKFKLFYETKDDTILQWLTFLMSLQASLMNLLKTWEALLVIWSWKKH